MLRFDLIGKGTVNVYNKKFEKRRGHYYCELQRIIKRSCTKKEPFDFMMYIYLVFTVLYYSLAVLYLLVGFRSKRFTKCLLKCLPIILLIFFTVLLLAVVEVDDLYKDSTRNRRFQLLIATTFSCIGDGCLVFPKIFIFGVISFAASLLLYTNLLELVDSLVYITLEAVLVGFCIFFIGVLITVTIRVVTSSSNKFPPIPKYVSTLILLYFTVLSVLLWSGLMLFLRRRDHIGAGAAVGVIMFYISDLMIAASAFWNMHLLQGRGLIMLTYYTAQLFLMLSIFYM